MDVFEMFSDAVRRDVAGGFVMSRVGSAVFVIRHPEKENLAYYLVHAGSKVSFTKSISRDVASCGELARFMREEGILED